MEYAFNEQNKLMDEIIYKMYDNNTTNCNELKDTLFKNIAVQHSMLDMFETQGLDISNTFQHRQDMNQQQQDFIQNITNQQKVMDERYHKISDANQMNQKQYEIYSYYYYKYRTQLKIVYVFLAFIIILILLTIIHKYFPYDKIYSILVGVLSACFVIYLFTQLYDIYLRSGHVFDEYEKTWNRDEIE